MSETLPIDGSTDLSTVTILSNGAEISQTFQLLSVTIEYEANRIPVAKIILADGDVAKQDFPVSNEESFAPGAKIDIQGGYHMKEESLFKGIVIRHGIRSKSGGSSLLTIICKDEAVKMTVAKKSKYFYKAKDSEIIEQIVSDYGLKSDVEATETLHLSMVQYQASDWDFIMTRAEMNGQLVFVRDGQVTVKKPDPSQKSAMTLTYGATIIECEMDMDAEGQLKASSTAGWDYAGQEEIKTEGVDPGFPEQGNIPANDLTKVISPDSFHMHHSGRVQDSELQAWSDSLLVRSRLSKIKGRIRCQGVSAVAPDNVITLEALGERFNGNAYVSALRHEFTPGNWVTDLQIGMNPKWFNRKTDIGIPAAAGMLPAVSGLQIGIVNKLEGDPDGEDRIQIRMPMIDANEDGVWTRICTLDAGPNERGTVFRPEIGDEVIVGFLYGDPRQPVMLGMLHSSANPAHIPASDDNDEKGYKSRKGIEVFFDDKKLTYEAKLPSGRIVKLDDDAGEIYMEDPSGNRVTLNDDGITFDSPKDVLIKAGGDIVMEGTNIDNAASAEFKADSGAGSKLTSSAITTLKGSLVEIN